jgi:sensor histidine kinase regulating citrate/malate metabolism
MDDTIDAMSQFNNTLRAQRHDFLNHLQVVYSLIEMEEYGEANDYIEQVYGKITAVSRVMKTANPAVNALLQVKVATCEKAGIQVDVSITSKWESLENTMPDWEMCKVLSNLIDNAVDAMEDLSAGKKHLVIALGENVKQYTFRVENTGEGIPVEIRERIFAPGFTTKGDGHGMGLHIVRRTLRERGGDISVQSDVKQTSFAGWLPKTDRKSAKES